MNFKKYKTTLLLVVLMMVGLMLVACSSKEEEYFTQTNIEETNKYFEEGKNGFVLIVTDNDEYFVGTVKRLAEENKVNVIMYNPYQSDGESDNDGASIFPKSTDIRGNSMYYLEDNEVVGELGIDKYADSQLTIEIEKFFELYK